MEIILPTQRPILYTLFYFLLPMDFNMHNVHTGPPSFTPKSKKASRLIHHPRIRGNHSHSTFSKKNPKSHHNELNSILFVTTHLTGCRYTDTPVSGITDQRSFFTFPMGITETDISLANKGKIDHSLHCEEGCIEPQTESLNIAKLQESSSILHDDGDQHPRLANPMWST